MVWIYLAESEGSQLPLENGLNQSPIAKSIPIVKECCSHEWPMNHYAIALSGMTLQHYRDCLSMGVSTSFMEGFHARILVLQELEKVWKESEADYFSRSLDCVAKLSRDLSFWRMFLPLLQGEEQKWSGKLPKWGMIVDGALYLLQALEQNTKEKDGSYWLTPTIMDHLPVRTGKALENALYRGKNRVIRRKVSGRLNEQVAYPKMWPTPDASMRGARINQNGHCYTLQDAVGSGKLNPQWVEWLMGYQIGWTELEPWAMQWFLSKRKKRSKS